MHPVSEFGANGHPVDPRWIDRHFAAHRHACFRVALSVTRDRQHAEDAVQAAYVDVWQSIERFDNGRGSMRGWLLTITYRRAVDIVRAEQARPRPKATELDIESSTVDLGRSPEESGIAAHDAGRVHAALMSLSVVQREVLVLAYFLDYSQAEIARVTGIPLGTVKTRTQSGLRLLRLALSADSPSIAAVTELS